METNYVAVENITVEPYEIEKILEMKITRAVNEHGIISMKGIIAEEKKDDEVWKTKTGSQISVFYGDGESRKPLFHGAVMSLQIKHLRGIYYIEIEAVSNSYEMDLKIKSRSFQNKKMAYKEFLDVFTGEYSGSQIVDNASNGKTLSKFTIQYQETDWQFLKRMASRFGKPVISNDLSEKTMINFGYSEDGAKETLDNFYYSVKKNIMDFKTLSENNETDAAENDFVFYEIETDKVINIGGQAEYKGKTFFVKKSIMELKGSIFRNTYTLVPKKGMAVKTIYNDEMTGASIDGKVIEVSKDKVKVHLDIDKKQDKAEAALFTYSTSYSAEGSSGWYCMPEINDRVRIYIPGHKEEDAFAVSSVRKSSKDGDKIGNPDVKYFRTKAGKELMFAPGEILISGKDGEIFISLNDKEGIKIVSKKGVKITSKENIVMNAEKKIVVSAKEELTMKCKESNVKMDGNIIIKGKEVKSN